MCDWQTFVLLELHRVDWQHEQPVVNEVEQGRVIVPHGLDRALVVVGKWLEKTGKHLQERTAISPSLRPAWEQRKK